MIKLSKTGWLIILIGLLAIAFSALGMTYSQQNREQTRLNQELALAQLLMKKTSSNYAEEKRSLEDSTVKTRAELGTLKATLSPGNESIEAVDTLFQIADACQVTMVDIASAPPAPENVSGMPFSALSLAVRIRGRSADILQFISNWTEKNITGIVKSVAITLSTDRVSENVTDNTTITDNITGIITDNVTDNLTLLVEMPLEPGRLIANINLVIYTYKGK